MMPFDPAVFIALLPSLLISAAMTGAMRRAAPKFGLIDHPASRKVHVTPTPLGGGVGIWLGVIGAFALLQWFLWMTPPAPAPGADQLPPSASEGLPVERPPSFLQTIRANQQGMLSKSQELWTLLAGATALMLLGLTDDRFGLHWSIRLAVQFGVSAFCVWRLDWAATLFIGGPAPFVISVIWVVALINSFNMLDNMDGLSGGVAAIAAFLLAIVLLTSGGKAQDDPQLFVAGFLLVLVGALVGFLFHNRPPAKIFMGDAGSYFVGFCVGMATLGATFTPYRSQHPYTIFAPLCVMAVPVYDMLTVLWIRFREGRSPFQADKCHFSHRLVELGMTKGQAVMTVCLTTATCGLGALMLYHADNAFGAALVLVMVFCVLSVIALLESASRKQRRSQETGDNGNC